MSDSARSARDKLAKMFEDAIMCGVCMEEMQPDNVWQLPCGHVFCYKCQNCIDEIAEAKTPPEKGRCSLCRKKSSRFVPSFFLENLMVTMNAFVEERAASANREAALTAQLTSQDARFRAERDSLREQLQASTKLLADAALGTEAVRAQMAVAVAMAGEVSTSLGGKRCRVDRTSEEEMSDKQEHVPSDDDRGSSGEYPHETDENDSGAEIDEGDRLYPNGKERSTLSDWYRSVRHGVKTYITRYSPDVKLDIILVLEDGTRWQGRLTFVDCKNDAYASMLFALYNHLHHDQKLESRSSVATIHIKDATCIEQLFTMDEELAEEWSIQSKRWAEVTEDKLKHFFKIFKQVAPRVYEGVYNTRHCARSASKRSRSPAGQNCGEAAAQKVSAGSAAALSSPVNTTESSGTAQRSTTQRSRYAVAAPAARCASLSSTR